MRLAVFMSFLACSLAASEPSCGWNSCNTRYITKPEKTDDFFSYTLDICNTIAKNLKTCCCFSDPYGTTHQVQNEHPEWADKMMSITAEDVGKGDFTQNQQTPYTTDVVDKNRCDNRKDKTTPQLCTISHSVTTGYTTSVTTSASYGVKAGLKTKGTANFIFAAAEVELSAELSYTYTSTDSQTQSKSTTDTVTVSKNVPPGECITLQLMSSKSSASGILRNNMNAKGKVAMWFRDRLQLSDQSGNLFLFDMSAWNMLAYSSSAQAGLDWTTPEKWRDSHLFTSEARVEIDYYQASSSSEPCTITATLYGAGRRKRGKENVPVVYKGLNTPWTKKGVKISVKPYNKTRI